MKRVLISMLLLFLVASCQQKQEPKSDGQTSSGQLHAQEEITLLQDMTTKDPHNGEAWVRLGNLLMDTNRFGEAIDAYQKALDIDPKDVDVRVDMGICYRNSGKPDIAVKEFRKGIEINPSHVNAHKNLAIVLAYDMHDSAGAVKEFEKSLQLEPNSPDAGRIKDEIQKLKASAK
jgi:cytochrome c-type biogenesis protein CcmH/NrfG